MSRPRSLPVRLYHGLQALAVVTAMTVAEPGETSHDVAGYLIAALLGGRLLWSWTGPPDDRLSTWLDTYRGRRHLLLLTGSLAGAVLTGHLQTTDAYWGDAAMMTAHAVFSYATAVNAAGHVAWQWRTAQRRPGWLRRMIR